MTIGDWVLTVTGTVVRIDRENIDKSGRNPKWMLAFVVRADGPAAIDAPAGATLLDELVIRCSTVDLARLTDTEPAAGDHVEMKARTSGPRPTLFYLTALRRL